MEPLVFTGASGIQYSYYISERDLPWRAVPLNYMFGKPMGAGSWFIAYIGQAQDASARIPCHERWDEAVRKHGVTVVLNHVASADLATREREERDLIQKICPPLNVQHKPDEPVRGALGVWSDLQPARSPLNAFLAPSLLFPRKTR